MKNILLILSAVMLLVGIASGKGMSQDISVSPPGKDFGSVMMGQSSSPQTFTITNTGGSALVVSSIELTGGDSRIFNLNPGTCGSLSPTVPPDSPGNSCSIIVVFSPASGGGKAAVLRIVSNALTNPVVARPLIGTGLQPLNVGLAPAADQTTYDFGGPIHLVLTLQNAGSDLYTSKGFKAKPFELFLIFKNQDEQVITSNLLKDTDLQDPPPPIVLVLPTGELVPNLEPVEKVEAGWVLSVDIPNALNFYQLSKGGDYSVKALIPMRTYPGIDYTDNRVDPPVDYASIDRYNSQGALESNIVTFTLLEPPAQTASIVIEPLSSTIIAGGSQSYKATAYAAGNLVDVTAATTFSMTNGTCALNVCTSSVSGNQEVTGSYEGKTATAALSVATLLSQTINFTAPPNILLGDPPFLLNATSSSGLPVTLIIVSGPATLSGKTVTITGVGTVIVRASQAGDSIYFPAQTVDRSFKVLYVYSGFIPPVSPTKVNTVTASRPLPVKWRITNSKGVGISDRGSFVSITSYKTDCTDWTLRIGDDVTESAVGGSGLQYLGNGNWQFNWATPKTYAGTCRIMTLKLLDGTEHTARFKFSK